MALWDLIGQATRQPLYKLLGGAVRKKIELAACMGIRPYDEAKAIARQYLDMGFSTLKTKAGRDAAGRPGHGARHPRRRGRSAEAAHRPNMGYAPEVAFALARPGEIRPRILRAADAVELHRASRPGCGDGRETPMALNESVTTPEIVLQILQLRAADVLLPDTYQCGGILAVKKVAALCEAAGVPCVFHCSHDLGLKTAAMLHVVASTPNFHARQRLHLLRPGGRHHFPAASPSRAASCEVPEGPGLGVTVDEGRWRNIACERVRRTGCHSPAATIWR